MKAIKQESGLKIPWQRIGTSQVWLELRVHRPMKLTGNLKSTKSSKQWLTVLFAVIVLFVGQFAAQPAYATDQSAESARQFWAALNRSGTFILMRHALAPGTGDPDQFSEHDCSTQRNLSQEGRAQAARIGEQLREHSTRAIEVFSSVWCRCMDTAELLGAGPVHKLAPLNSFFRQWEREQIQTDQLIEWMTQRESSAATVLVTHQVNITAMSGVYPTSGEMVAVRLNDDRTITVLGQLAIP